MAHTKNYPFYDWVPKPLGIIILIMLFCPIMFINGAYTINSGEMSAGLGIISEHIQYASYAGAIGMVVFAPFMQRGCEETQNDVNDRLHSVILAQLYLCNYRQLVTTHVMQSHYGFYPHGSHFGKSICSHTVCI